MSVSAGVPNQSASAARASSSGLALLALLFCALVGVIAFGSCIVKCFAAYSRAVSVEFTVEGSYRTTKLCVQL